MCLIERNTEDILTMLIIKYIFEKFLPPIILRQAAFLTCFRENLKYVTLKEKELFACCRYIGVILALSVLYCLHSQSTCTITLFKIACFVLPPPLQTVLCGDLQFRIWQTYILDNLILKGAISFITLHFNLSSCS